MLSVCRSPRRERRRVGGVSSICGALTSRVLPRLHHSHLALGCRVVNGSSSRVTSLTSSGPGRLALRRLLCTTALAGSGNGGRMVCAGTARLFPGSCHTFGGLNGLTCRTNGVSGTRSCLGGTTGVRTTPRIGVGLNLMTLTGNSGDTTRSCLNGTSNTGRLNRAVNGLCVTRNRCRETMGSFNSTGAGDTTLTRVLTGSCGGTGGALTNMRGPSTCASCLVTMLNTEAGGLSVLADDLGDTITGSSSLTGGTTASLRFTGCFIGSSFVGVVGWAGPSCFV